MQKKVLYWSPHINKQVATVKAVLNSAYSLSKYSDNFKPIIVNAFGEWDDHLENFKKLNISSIKISNNKSKIKFEMDVGVLISKVIDGRFPDYNKVIPKNNDKILEDQQNFYKYNEPKTLEQLHYRMIFESYFPNCNLNIIPKFWMPNFVDATDASARTLDVYKKLLKK